MKGGIKRSSTQTPIVYYVPKAATVLRNQGERTILESHTAGLVVGLRGGW